MLYDIIELKILQDYLLFLRFEDGLEGVVDMSKLLPFEGVFSKLQDINYFRTVHLNKELGTIAWDNGADLSPEYLYSILSHKVA